jgi:hypothetical protein
VRRICVIVGVVVYCGYNLKGAIWVALSCELGNYEFSESWGAC